MLTIERVTDPKYTDARGTGIDVIVKFAEFAEPVPFHATEADTEPHGKAIYRDAKAGIYGPISVFIEPATKPVDMP